jgi:type I restriction enzyme, S subunit
MNQDVKGINPIVGIDPMYIVYYLISSEHDILSRCSKDGTTVASIDSESLKIYPTPLPPSTEQQRIVSAIEQQFTRLDAAVAALRRAQAKLKRYRAAVLKAAVEGKLTEAWRAEHPTIEPASLLLERILKERRAKWEGDLRAKGKDPAKVKYIEPAKPDIENLPELPELPEGWCWATVGQLASTDKYSLAIGPFGSNLKVEDYRDKGVPLIFVRNIRSAVFDGPDTRYVTLDKAEELRAHQIVGEDILITKMGDPPGDVCLYPKAMPRAIITADCIKWTLSPILSQKLFFVNAINSSLVKIQILGITKGVAQLKVSLGRFEGVCIPLPPLIEQEQIVAEVEQRLSIVTQLEATVEANLKRAERLRQSILKEAFAGRLVPQDPNDEPASVLLERIRKERDGRQKGVVSNDRYVSVSNEPVQIDLEGARQVELWDSIGG